MVSCDSDELEAPLRVYGQRQQGQGSSAYASSDYWNARFRDTEGIFDWYATYTELEGVFREFYPACKKARNRSMLVVGSGNSALSAELYQAGYRGITNIDISSEAIKKMHSHFSDLDMEWLDMDATSMAFDGECFDTAVDKGTLDAMMSSGSGHEIAMAMVAEIWRVLRPGGVFLLVSHNGKRLPLLQEALALQEGEEASEKPARWRCMDLRRNRLSPQATFINVLRSKLQGRPMAEAFRDPEMLREATEEARAALKQMAFLEAFRLFKARKRAESGAAKQEAGCEGEPSADREESEPRDPPLQPFCWVYVLQKSL
eukprot:TRINITY_DN2632_c0_g1_i1.p1 TRINITY_DN2632_c0_g1~~TRINITY_DN2632_c0_g1_i1.p1  ORF type:complete len:334 (-),score=65.81 TRINITY_DN2632_c0_g1_i1:25-972(-)